MRGEGKPKLLQAVLADDGEEGHFGGGTFRDVDARRQSGLPGPSSHLHPLYRHDQGDPAGGEALALDSFRAALGDTAVGLGVEKIRLAPEAPPPWPHPDL